MTIDICPLCKAQPHPVLAAFGSIANVFDIKGRGPVAVFATDPGLEVGDVVKQGLQSWSVVGIEMHGGAFLLRDDGRPEPGRVTMRRP